MQVREAAARLGVAEHQVLSLREHAAGCLAELRDGPVMLIAETVVRPYVADVDDPKPVKKAAAPRAAAKPAAPKSAAKPVKKAAKKAVKKAAKKAAPRAA